MKDVTRLLSKMEAGDQKASAELLPLVYDELRKLAAARMANERADHTLSATALVHEAYVRLVDVEKAQNWDSRGHFFSAAAEAMRRILIDDARRKARPKHGGDFKRLDFDTLDLAGSATPETILGIDEALRGLAEQDPAAARIVELRYFCGLTIEQSAEALGVSSRTAYRNWTFARAWLCSELLQNESIES